MARFSTMRRPDWTIRWTEFMKDSMDLAVETRLDWDDDGITCTSWAGDGIEALTGANPFDPYRGSFNGILGACKAIKESGFKSLDDLIASLFQEVPVGMAQTGDLVLVRSVDWAQTALEHNEYKVTAIMPHAVALVDPPLYWAVTEQGLGKGDLYADAVRAFAIGRTI